MFFAVFSFLYLKKNKISKIYVRFEIFQKYTPVALHRATGPMCNFFFQICNEVPGEKKKRGACRPPNGRQAPVARWGGDRVLCFSLANKAYWISFLQRLKIYCDIFAEGFGNWVRIIMKFTEGVGCQFWWAMRPLKDDTRETNFMWFRTINFFVSADVW